MPGASFRMNDEHKASRIAPRAPPSRRLSRAACGSLRSDVAALQLDLVKIVNPRDELPYERRKAECKRQRGLPRGLLAHATVGDDFAARHHKHY